MSGDGETSEEQLGSWGAIRTLVWDRSHVQIFRLLLHIRGTSNWQLAFGIWRLAEIVATDINFGVIKP